MAGRLPSERILEAIPEHIMTGLAELVHASKYNLQELNNVIRNVETLFEQQNYPEVIDLCNIIVQQEADEPGCTPLFQLGRLQEYLARAFIEVNGSTSRSPVHICMIQVDLIYLQTSKASIPENSCGAH
jgi:hypothetical protein